MINNNSITDSLLEMVPYLTERYKETIERISNSLFEEFGPTMRKVYNSSQARNYQLVREVFVKVEESGPRHSFPDLRIDSDKVEKLAARMAKMAALEWEAKLLKKLGNVEDVKVVSYGNTGDFAVSAKKNNHEIQIFQQMIIKVSCHGKWFNQFPARIYVDGKPFSEKKYKELVEA
ncbi:MAG: hypothetical protein ACOCUT_04380 [bacterium]